FTGTTLSHPVGSTAPVITSMHAVRDPITKGASPAACVAWIRNFRTPPLTAPPSRGRWRLRHTVERRRIALGVDVFAQYRARALRERQRLNGQALQVLPNQLFGLCWG